MKKYDLLSRLTQRQSGQALISMLVFMALGAIILAPVLNYIGTGLLVGQLFEEKTDEYYAADAGIEDSLWLIQNDRLESFLSGYDRYDYSTQWGYDLTGSNQINNLNVNILVNNEWMPYGLPAPEADQARAVITEPKILISGQVTGNAKIDDVIDPDTLIYKITLSYDYEPGDNLTVSSIGLWLPSGFSYADYMSLENDPEESGRPTDTDTYAHKGNQEGAIVWTFNSIPFEDLYGVDENVNPMVCQLEVYVHTADRNRSLEALSWINTNTDLGDGITYAWDADTNIFRVNSTAGSAQVEAYAIQSKLRDLNSAVNGDYIAVGNSLMIDTTPGDNLRNTLLAESSSTVSGIPEGASVDLAYIYWSGWLSGDTTDAVRVPTGDGDINGSWVSTGASTDTGWLNPSANNAVSGGDGNGFETNPTNAYADDSVHARNNNGAGDRHVYYNYNISAIPLDSIILGIEVRLDWWLDSTSGTSSMRVELSWDSGTNWTAYKADDNESTSSHTATLGGGSDTWGHAWTVSELASLRVRLTCISSSSSRDFRLDWVPVRITYSGVDPGNLYSLVDEGPTPNDTDYFVGSTNGGGYSLFTFDPFNVPAGNTIYGLTVVIRASDNGASNDGNIYGAIKIGNTYYYYDSSPQSPTGSGYTTFEFTWPKNPRTNEYWTVSEINGIGLNSLSQFGVASSDLNPDIHVSMVYAEVDYHVPDTVVTFTVNGNSHELTADIYDPEEVQSDLRLDPNTPANPVDGFYYGCRVDVTSFVRNESNGADLSANPQIFGNGNGTYEVGDVDADTQNFASFAGWSLVIIYSSPETKGHQVYLYDLKDTFSSVPAHAADGGATVQTTEISGFIVPARITDPVTGEKETDVAKITIFVGEGDAQLPNDYVALIDQHDAEEHKLWDGITVSSNSAGSPNNVWNGQSVNGSQEGVDIDNFTIKWDDEWLLEDDTSAQIKLYTNGDGYVVVYMIMSFRSSVTAGGAISYLIR